MDETINLDAMRNEGIPLGAFDFKEPEPPERPPKPPQALQSDKAAAAEELQCQPEDYTDVGQARALCKIFGKQILYSRATGWMVYDGKRWIASEEAVRDLAHKLTDMQYREAQMMLDEARKAEDSAARDDDEALARLAKSLTARAKAYRAHAKAYRKAPRISATLQEATPYVILRDVKDLDKDPYLLNTPTGTIDLRTGEMREHRASDYITKITTCGPSSEGRDEFSDFLRQLTGGDTDLEKYLQMGFGMAVIGEVLDEKLLIAYGSGGNGKSTCCNAVYSVLGDYAGSISSEVLIITRSSGPQYELADLRGKRLILAAELQEGQRLNTSIIKRMCSTDSIKAEKKFKDPFEFRPSHTIILFTNHLPKIGSNDRGTLDRLVVLPFKGRFRDTKAEIKNYAQVLADRCGGAILTWLIEGARMYIASGYRLPRVAAVDEATAAYLETADWLRPFLDACCEIERGDTVRAGDLYAEYRRYCQETGETYIRSATDFKYEMEQAGYSWRKTMHGAIYSGLMLKREALLRDSLEAPPFTP